MEDKPKVSSPSAAGLIITVIIVVVVIVGLKKFPIGENTGSDQVTKPVACTMDAKVCPDGSSVGRVGPDCGFAACPVVSDPKPIPVPHAKRAEFNGRIVAMVGNTFSFNDGLSFRVNAINDSRCAPNVQCVWQGEISVDLTASGGKFGSTSEKIRIGTVNTQSFSMMGYEFSLDSATENTATIIVLRK